MSLNLYELGRSVDEALAKETPESLMAFLEEHGHNFESEKELKPCPFCGGQAGITKDYFEDTALHKTRFLVVIECQNKVTCGASLGVVLDSEEAAKETAFDNWNKRIS